MGAGVRTKVAGAPHPVDLHVGHEVRRLRKARGLSQAALGASFGVTFQQVQKYERGVNRISVSALVEIGRALGVPAAYFLTGLSDQAGWVIGMTPPAVEAAEPTLERLTMRRRRLVERLVAELAGHSPEGRIVP